MKTRKLLAIGACAAFALMAMNLPAAIAHEGEHDEKSEPSKIPETADGIMAEIHKHDSELDQVVKNNKLAEVHHHAFAVRDLAKALVDKAPADKKQRVQGAVNNIAKLAEELDKSGDAGDKAKTEANLKKFDAVIAQLEGQLK